MYILETGLTPRYLPSKRSVAKPVQDNDISYICTCALYCTYIRIQQTMFLVNYLCRQYGGLPRCWPGPNLCPSLSPGQNPIHIVQLSFSLLGSRESNRQLLTLDLTYCSPISLSNQPMLSQPPLPQLRGDCTQAVAGEVHYFHYDVNTRFVQIQS